MVALEFLGHAGVRLEHQGVSLLCDPWLSDDGAYLHSQHQFPPPGFIDRGHLYAADFLCLTSDRPDHFDPRFLHSFPKEKVTVVLADFASDILRRRVTALGFPRIIVANDWEEIHLGSDLSLKIVRNPVLYKTDSFLLIRGGGRTVLNANDCEIPESLFGYLRIQKIGALLVQPREAPWFPYAYDYPIERQAELARTARTEMIDDIARLVRGTTPGKVILGADPPCFLEDATVHLNSRATGLAAEELVAELGRSGLTGLLAVSTGDRLTLTSEDTPRADRKAPLDSVDSTEWLSSYRRARLPGIDAYLKSLPTLNEHLVDAFAAYLDRLFSASRYLRDRVEAGVEFTLTPGTATPASGPAIGAQSIYVEAHPGGHTVSREAPPAVNYRFILPAGEASLLVDGIETWDTALCSLRVAIRCQPDHYNWPLFALVRYGHDPALVYLVERAMRKGEFDTGIVEFGGHQYRIQRYCPHAGEDLTLGRIVDGNLTCPGHGWVFDLQNGGACIRGGNLRIRVVREETPA